MLSVAFVGIAIVDIQNLRRTEPVLIGLAAVGYTGYGLLCWLMWKVVRRCRSWLGGVSALVLYLVSMAGLFFVATVVYLVLEYGYLRGYFPRLPLA
jgi:hypothetical protein